MVACSCSVVFRVTAKRCHDRVTPKFMITYAVIMASHQNLVIMYAVIIASHENFVIAYTLISDALSSWGSNACTSIREQLSLGCVRLHNCDA